MKTAWIHSIILLVLAVVHTGYADESILLQRIIALENRVAELEEKLTPVLEEEHHKQIILQQQKLAFDRMMLDAEILSRPELRKIEQIYKTIQADWKTENSKKGFELLIKQYPTANRTGCAILYMGQMTTGTEQLNYLKQAIEKHSGCYYENGVNVGAYARLYLGMRYQKEGKEKEAKLLFEEIRTTYTNSIDHKGRLLTSHLTDLK